MSNNLLKKIYFPSCKECDGLLNITINPINFSVEYICDKCLFHYNKNIFFKTFERFYLKEQEIYECKKCDLNLEKSEFYKCEECKSFYCGKCCLEDIKNNNHKKIFYEKSINKCNEHNCNFYGYCVKCIKNICLLCLKENDIHKNHTIKYFSEIVPSLNDIENLKKSIKEKKNYYNNLIEKIDIWKKEVFRKAEQLKQNLKDEISFIEKIINNYNYSFENYTYFKLFNTIKNYIENTIKRS